MGNEIGKFLQKNTFDKFVRGGWINQWMLKTITNSSN